MPKGSAVDDDGGHARPSIPNESPTNFETWGVSPNDAVQNRDGDSP